MKRSEKPEAAKVYDASKNERRQGEKQPIFPVKGPLKPPAAELTTMAEFELEEQRLLAQEKSERELAELRSRMEKFINDSGTTVINFEKPGSIPEERFEDNEKMGRIDEIFGLIEESDLDKAIVDQLFEALENLITAISRSDIDEQQIDQIIGVIKASKLEDAHKKELIGELSILYDATIMEIDGSGKS
ncbi:MAG: hypothetical protein WCW66_03900 [Patescibacteria group bacterium]